MMADASEVQADALPVPLSLPLPADDLDGDGETDDGVLLAGASSIAHIGPITTVGASRIAESAAMPIGAILPADEDDESDESLLSFAYDDDDDDGGDFDENEGYEGDDLEHAAGDADEDGADQTGPLMIGSQQDARRLMAEFHAVNDFENLIPLREIGAAKLEHLLQGPPWRTLKAIGVTLPARFSLSAEQEAAYDVDAFDRDVLDGMALELMTVLPYFLKLASNLRRRRGDFSSLQDLVRQLQASESVLVITGAGISTSLGIPDFRSSGGIYDRLEKYNLSDPQEMFDIHLFRHDPSIFCDFARELLPADRGYSATHAFVRLLQDKGKLLRDYTQNIDDIESTAGIDAARLVQCHGSFRRATCITCDYSCDGRHIFPAIQRGDVPKCPACADADAANATARDAQRREAVRNGKKRKRYDNDYDDDSDDDDESPGGGDASHGVMKPDIVFFGEQLPDDFRSAVLADAKVCDLVLCIGTSLRVAPVADLPLVVRASVPQALLNAQPLRPELRFDVELLGGPCDDAVTLLAHACGWGDEFEQLCAHGNAGTRRVRQPPDVQALEKRFEPVEGGHTYLLDGDLSLMPRPFPGARQRAALAQEGTTGDGRGAEGIHWPTIVDEAMREQDLVPM